MKLVDDWKKAYKWFSVQAMSLTGIAATAWLSVPEDLRNAVNPDWLAAGAIILTVLGILGRMVKQDESE